MKCCVLIYLPYISLIFDAVMFRLVEQQSVVFVCAFVHASVLEMFV